MKNGRFKIPRDNNKNKGGMLSRTENTVIYLANSKLPWKKKVFLHKQEVTFLHYKAYC